MGLMPGTAASLGLETDALTNPAENIRAGAEYLRKLLNNFRPIESREEQLKMALAAYNGGIGHVMDARALARKYGGDDSLWEGPSGTSSWRLEQYYTDPVSKSGYLWRRDGTLRT